MSGTYDLSHNHDNKLKARQALSEGRTEPYKCILTLPSEEIGCIKDLYSRGLLNADTKIVAFEKDRKAAHIIRHKLNILGFKEVFVYATRLENKTSIEAIKAHHRAKPFDLIYLDFCGECTDAIGEMAKSCSDVLREAATCATFYLGPRHKCPSREEYSTKYVGDNPLKIYGVRKTIVDRYVRRASQVIGYFSHCANLDSRNLKDFTVYSEEGKNSQMVFVKYLPHETISKEVEAYSTQETVKSDSPAYNSKLVLAS